jgi:phosphoenolpyruvate synthase/pyruvate phosphate dikinase
VKGDGHVTSAAILDFRIFPEKSEEKKDIKKLFFQLKSMDKQVSDKKQPLFYLYRHLLLNKL